MEENGVPAPLQCYIYRYIYMFSASQSTYVAIIPERTFRSERFRSQSIQCECVLLCAHTWRASWPHPFMVGHFHFDAFGASFYSSAGYLVNAGPRIVEHPCTHVKEVACLLVWEWRREFVYNMRWLVCCMWCARDWQSDGTTKNDALNNVKVCLQLVRKNDEFD